jgi:hypothetical protein
MILSYNYTSVKILNDYTIKIIIIVCRTTTIKMHNINTIALKDLQLTKTINIDCISLKHHRSKELEI